MRTGGADVTALHYVRTLKRNNLTGSGKASAEALGHHGGASVASQNNLLDWADKTFGQGLSQVAKGMKTLLTGRENRVRFIPSLPGALLTRQLLLCVQVRARLHWPCAWKP